MDVTSNQSLSYQLDDMEAAKIKAVEDALRRAHGEASAVAAIQRTHSGRSLLRIGRHVRAISDTPNDDGEGGCAHGGRLCCSASADG